MPENARFRVAVHVLTLLEHEKGRALTSTFVAGSVNTNPVVIRRILGLLARAGLVSTREGARGGARLARPAARITLADAYRAVETEGLFGETRNDPNPRCPVGRSVQKVLGRHCRRFEESLRSEMDEVTVADVLAGVRRAAARRSMGGSGEAREDGHRGVIPVPGHRDLVVRGGGRPGFRRPGLRL